MGWKAVIASVAFGLFALTTPVSSEPAAVTVDEVLANPAKYDGKPVRVHGFATVEFENSRLWQDEAAFRNYRADHAVHVEWDKSQPTHKAAKGRLAYVTATFRSHYGTPVLGDLTSVQRDPTDHGPDRGWWSDPQFGTIFALLSVLGIIGLWLAFATNAQKLLNQPGWSARKPNV
jgi:hypothetical protein